jgi:uncharacterized protein (TIGR00299 family) protein
VAHDHDHEHDHDHVSDHVSVSAHDHDHDHRGDRSRGALKRGEGKGKILFLDAPSGLAGDMIIAALVDLGVPEAVITDSVGRLGLGGFHVHFARKVRSGIVATAFDVHVDQAQPERTYADVRAVIEQAALDAGVKARALATFARLAEAEAKVHQSPIDSVHFHEVGSIDALVDVVGSAAALEYLGADVVVSPLPMGRGFVRAAHGVLPLPAPATVECLRGLPTYDGGLDFEFVTPTGAAIVSAHARASSRWPAIVPEGTGWGAGTKDLPDRPNLLRAVIGATTPDADEHVVLETNIDDATGELVGNALEVLLQEGALDAWATPITMKKGRPAFMLSAIATKGRASAIGDAMIRETTTLGVRIQPAARIERPRRIVEVPTRFGPIPVKIAEGPFGPPQLKPELDACREAARVHGVPLREVIAEAVVAARGRA